MLLSRLRESTKDDFLARLQQNQAADAARRQHLQRLSIQKNRARVSRQREQDRHREAVEKSRRDEEDQKVKQRDGRRAAKEPECGCHEFVRKLEKAFGL